MGGVREDGHVGPDLGDDALRCALADARDRVEVVTGATERGDHPVDLGVELADRVLELLDVLEREPDGQGMMLAEAAMERLAERWQLGAQAALGERGESLWVALAGDEHLIVEATDLLAVVRTAAVAAA